MNVFEAMKALGEGKKVRRKNWEYGEYLMMDEDLNILDEKDNVFGFINLNLNDDDWEIIEERSEVEQLLKDLYKILNALLEDDDWNQYDKFIGDDTNHMRELFRQLKEMNRYYKLDK